MPPATNRLVLEIIVWSGTLSQYSAKIRFALSYDRNLIADSCPATRCQRSALPSPAQGRRTGKILMTFSPFPVQKDEIPPPCFQTARTAAGIEPALRRGGLSRFLVGSPVESGMGGRIGVEGVVMR